MVAAEPFEGRACAVGGAGRDEASYRARPESWRLGANCTAQTGRQLGPASAACAGARAATGATRSTSSRT